MFKQIWQAIFGKKETETTQQPSVNLHNQIAEELRIREEMMAKYNPAPVTPQESKKVEAPKKTRKPRSQKPATTTKEEKPQRSRKKTETPSMNAEQAEPSKQKTKRAPRNANPQNQK